VEKLRRALWVIKEKRVAVLGLAFKANTDDIRFAPAIDLIKRLIDEGASVCAHDPQAMEKVRAQLPEVELGDDVYVTAKDAEALIVATEWEEFKTLDWERIRDTMSRPLIFDARNLLRPATMKALGFEYYSVGRPH
jgi:UDPglucose 6-dehydrogenase